MYLKNLSITNFKNYHAAELIFSEKVNCFVGNNGVGKTNLLDAIHYLSLCKSYFNPIDSQNINYDADFSVIQGNFFKNDSEDEIFCGIQRNKRKIFKRNKKEYQKLSDHIGLFPLVMISPADSSLITEGGEERRKFLNSVISQYDKNYLENLLLYNRALIQRNKLLKDLSDTPGYDRDMLAIWNEQLIKYGESIYEIRKDFISKIQPVFHEYYQYISSDRENAELIYESQLSGSGMEDILSGSLKRDLLLGFTTAGIHKDDLLLNLSGHSLKKSGSQGQQKTYQVALKLAKFGFIKKVSGINPILLLDDIFDKFDLLRLEQIIKLVANGNFGQIFITDTNHEHLTKILKRIRSEHTVFTIHPDQKIEKTS